MRRTHGRQWLSVAISLVAVLAAQFSAALATGNTLDLGKPTNAVSTNAYFPMGEFHRINGKAAARLGGSVEFYYEPRDSFTNEEEWPFLKALEQFGTLAGIQAAPPVCYPPPPTDPAGMGQVCYVPGFDLARASFKSHFIRAALRPLTDDSGRCLVVSMSNADWRRLLEFTQVSTRSRSRFCWGLVSGQFPDHNFNAPVLEAGSFVQTGVQLVQQFDYSEPLPTPAAVATLRSYPDPLSGLPFATIQRALATDHDPAGTTLNEDVNAEANVITALICHTDGGKPRSVCGRSVIKAILKHVK